MSNKKRFLFCYLLSFLIVSNLTFLLATRPWLLGIPKLDVGYNSYFLSQSYFFSAIPFGKGVGIIGQSFWFDLLFLVVALTLVIGVLRDKVNEKILKIWSYGLALGIILVNVLVLPAMINGSTSDPEYQVTGASLHSPMIFLSWANFQVVADLALILFITSKRIKSKK